MALTGDKVMGPNCSAGIATAMPVDAVLDRARELARSIAAYPAGVRGVKATLRGLPGWQTRNLLPRRVHVARRQPEGHRTGIAGSQWVCSSLGVSCTTRRRCPRVDERAAAVPPAGAGGATALTR